MVPGSSPGGTTPSRASLRRGQNGADALFDCLDAHQDGEALRINAAVRADEAGDGPRVGHRHARAVMDENDLERLVREQARPGDIVVCLGAGTISAWANNLPGRLSKSAA